MALTPEEKAEKRRKYLEWEARKIAEDPLWKEKQREAAKKRAADRYQNDPAYREATIRRAKERQARRIMTGEHLEYHRKYREENSEKMRQMWRDYRTARYSQDPAFRERRKKEAREAAKTPEYKARMKDYRAMRRATDPNFKIADNCRRRINDAIAGRNKSADTLALLGCSIAELKKHLESKWTPGMSWMTYGKHGWEIDHIKPCDSWDLSDPEQQRACFHYTNLQPLWREHNQSKGNRSTYRAEVVPAALDVI